MSSQATQANVMDEGDRNALDRGNLERNGAIAMYNTGQLNNLQSNVTDSSYYTGSNTQNIQQYSLQPGGDATHYEVVGTKEESHGIKHDYSTAQSSDIRQDGGSADLKDYCDSHEGSPPDSDEDDDGMEDDLDNDPDHVQPLPKPFSKKNLKRHRLSHSETRFLLNEFVNNPHPDAAQRGRLAKQVTGLSSRQIQVWFQNRRAKLKRMSAPDAERLLSSRSYPEGYGPAGFSSTSLVVNRDPAASSPYMQPVEGVFASQMSQPREQIVYNNARQGIPVVPSYPGNNEYQAEVEEAKKQSQQQSTQGIYAGHNYGVHHIPEHGSIPTSPMPGLAPYSIHAGRSPMPMNQQNYAARPIYQPRSVPFVEQGQLPPPYYQRSNIPIKNEEQQAHAQAQAQAQAQHARAQAHAQVQAQHAHNHAQAHAQAQGIPMQAQHYAQPMYFGNVPHLSYSEVRRINEQGTYFAPSSAALPPPGAMNAALRGSGYIVANQAYNQQIRAEMERVRSRQPSDVDEHEETQQEAEREPQTEVEIDEKTTNPEDTAVEKKDEECTTD